MTEVYLLGRVEEARTRRDRQVQALDVALVAALEAGCSVSAAARSAHMTPQGLRKRLHRLSTL
jgi:hypothetical protein